MTSKSQIIETFKMPISKFVGSCKDCGSEIYAEKESADDVYLDCPLCGSLNFSKEKPNDT